MPLSVLEAVKRRAGSESRKRAWFDLLILCGLCVGGFLLAGALDVAERFEAFAERHENWQLDEVIVLLLLLAVTGVIFAIRRSRDLKHELTAREEAEENIRRLALHDPLTGLANRRKIHDALAQAIRHRKRPDEVTGFLLIDLDRFKPVNDTHGHAVGDRLLREVAVRLQDSVREGEMVARLGGDEFAVLLPHAASAEAASRPARRIIKAIEAPFAIDQLKLRIGASIGLAVTADPNADPDALIHHADVALYRAKREGRGALRFFEEDMDGEMRARARLELEFREALHSGAVTPYYQPLVELSTGGVKGYELLARWQHPSDGLIPPEVFIPIAEDTGMIGEMSLRLLRQACIDARAWPGRPMLAVNISPVQLRDAALPEKLLLVLEETGFDPERLEVEITETALVEDFDAAKKVLTALKAQGVKIALDDFGTGYSSLHHLRQLPFDLLKIDRSFIMSMTDSDESQKIVDAIIGLSHSLGLKTVAEGIEDAAAAEKLAALGCELGQGFLYGRPGPEVAAFHPAPQRVA